MSVNFPATPSVNQVYSYNGSTWQWNGRFWQAQTVPEIQGSTGATGPQGATGATGLGATGATGPQGATGPGSDVAIRDEGNLVVASVSSINFTGVGVTATAAGSNVTVNITGAGGAFYQNTAPVSSIAGDRWIDSDTLIEYVNIYDGDSYQWVETVSEGSSGANRYLSNLLTTSISANLVPASNVTYDLGTSSLRWRDLYLSGNTLNIGDTAVKTTANGLAFMSAANLAQPVSIMVNSLQMQTANGIMTVTASESGLISTMGNAAPVDVRGATGATGPAGTNGTIGVDGATGSTGPQGATGLTGATGAGSFAFANTAPSSPVVGARWLNSDNMIEYIYVPDGNSSQWVQPTNLSQIGATGAQGNIGLTGATGVTGTTGATGPTATPGGSAGHIQYNSGSAFAGSANLFWDNTNARLGIGTASPAVKLEIFGTGEVLRLDSAAGQSKSIYLRNVGAGTAKIFSDGTLTLETNATYPITFATQSTEKVRITTAGELLIGSNTNPGSAKAIIVGASGQAFEFFPGSATSTNTLQHYNRSTSAYMSSRQVALDYVYETSGNEALRITTNRQIGVYGSPTATGGTTAGQLTINRPGISDALTDVNYALYIPLNNGGGGANSGSGDYGGIHIRCTSAPNYVPVYGIKSQIVSMVGTGQINYAGWFYAHSGDSGAQSTGVYAQSNSAGQTGLYSTIYAVRAYASSTSDGTTHSNYAGYFYNDGKTNNYVLSLADQYASAATRTIVAIARNSTSVGSITTTLSATAYNTTSDYRLKSNVTQLTNALSDVMAMNPVRFNWNNTNESGLGFIAHELQTIVPQAVTGTKDEVASKPKRDSEHNIITDQSGNVILEDQPVYQSVDTSFLVAHLVAAIQEQQAQIANLSARLATVENK